MEPAKKQECLDLVEEIQETRAGRKLKLSDVPHILLPYQARWHEDRSPVRIAEKSRRIGWSWGALAAESVLEAAAVRGMDQFYTGYNLRMAAEFIGDCAFFCRAFAMAASAIDVTEERVIVENEARDIVTYKIEMASGRKIEALSSNPHNWRGRQGHARIDEAAFHSRLAELVKGALAFRMWGGRVSIVSTHNGEDNDFNNLVKEVQAKKLPWSHHKVTFDDALREGFFRRVCLVQSLPWTQPAEQQYRAEIYGDYPAQADADEELGCIPKRGSGAYFTRLLIEFCAEEGIPVLRLAKPAEFVLDPDRKTIIADWIAEVLKPIVDAMPTGWRTVYGQDFGRDGDLSCIWILQWDGARWRTAFILELRRLPFDCQWQITDYILDNVPLFHHASFDARGNGQSHAEAALQKCGSQKIACVKATPEFYANQFPKYRQAYEDKSIVVPKSEDVIADHRQVVLQAGRPTMSDGRIKGSDGEFRHGDTAIGGLMAWHSASQEGEPPAGETVDSGIGDAYAPQGRPTGLVGRPKPLGLRRAA